MVLSFVCLGSKNELTLVIIGTWNFFNLSSAVVKLSTAPENVSIPPCEMQH